MATAANRNNDTGNGDDGGKTSGQPQQAQPVLSLLEKYSSLHRGIDEARKEYARRQLEIESMEGEILRLVDVDRVAANEAIQTAIREKEALLQTLEHLTLTDLVEAQEAESQANSNLEFVRFKEEKAMRIAQDDENQFLSASKVFREKIRTLSLRGELFGLKTPVALLLVYKFLHSPEPSEFKQMTDNMKERRNNAEGEDYDGDNGNLLLADINLLREDENDSIDIGDGKNQNVEQEDDEEIQDVLEQLRLQNESNNKRQKILDETKRKYWRLMEAKQKREKQKKDLQSQCERLQKNAREVESQIENLDQQTREAIELTDRFRNDVEGDSKFETSVSKTAHSIKSPRSTRVSHPGRGNKRMSNTTNDHLTISRRKSTTTCNNPYARPSRRKHCTTAISETTSNDSTRMISPAAESATASPQPLQVNKKSRRSNNGEVRHSTPFPHALEHQTASMTPTNHRHQHPVRSKRVRPSRHFGASSFRTPSESLMRVTVGNTNGRYDCNTATENTAKSALEKRAPKRTNSLMLHHDDEDEDDYDDDDISWLNAPSFLSSSRHNPS